MPVRPPHRRRTVKPRPGPELEAKAGTDAGPPRAEVTTRHEFSAAHRLYSPHLSPAENHALFGPCAREHGHTYRLEVTVRGPVHPRTGMVIDLVLMRRLIDEWVAEHLDHRHLDRDVPFLEGRHSTLENLAALILHELGPLFEAGGQRLCRVTLAESDAARVTVTG